MPIRSLGVAPTNPGDVATKGYVDSVVSVAQAALVGVNAQIGPYTTVLADAGKLITIASSSAATVTVPANATVGYPLGAVLSIANISTGAITIVGASGVTISGPAGARITTPYAQASLVKISIDVWLLSGQTVT